MKDQKLFKLGTRGSLLAVTQSSLIKEQILEHTTHKIELEKIVTQGDKIQDVPLWQIDGKDFFTKELDQALLDGSVDFVVHSYKDLGSDRPSGIKKAAITKRKFAHDILLISNETIQKLGEKKEFIVGTSSPRRQANINEHLRDFLPHIQDDLVIKCENLRGNVNTRIQKLKDKNYDAIILALAGLERLASKSDSRAQLTELLDGMNFMLMPQKYFTSSAAQGALALECHENAKDDLLQALQSVHCEQTDEEVSKERKAFNQYGGGCHLAVGIHVKQVQDFFVHIHNGTVDNKKIKKFELEGYDHTHLAGKKAYFVFKEHDFLIEKEKINFPARSENLFVTSSHCFHNLPKTASSLWASGNRTMKTLIKKGFWINGSAEGFGHQEILDFKNSKAIALMLKQSSWKVLSHDKAKSAIGEVVPSYKHTVKENFDLVYEKEMLRSDIIFWNSKIQYNQYTERYPELLQKQHACGLGKTYSLFKEDGIDVIPCLDMNHLNEIIQG